MIVFLSVFLSVFFLVTRLRPFLRLSGSITQLSKIRLTQIARFHVHFFLSSFEAVALIWTRTPRSLEQYRIKASYIIGLNVC